MGYTGIDYNISTYDKIIDDLPDNNDEQLKRLKFLIECKRSGILYQNQFRENWNMCEEQIRCVHPKEWEKKEDWQSKIYIPLQAKCEEVALSYMNDILFSQGRYFECLTNSRKVDSLTSPLGDLIDELMTHGKFEVKNDFTMREGISLGTGFMKILYTANRRVGFAWRSAYTVLIDPFCGHDIDKARFVCDVYEKDIDYLVEEARRGDSPYDPKVIKQFVEDARIAADQLLAQRTSQATNTADGYKQLMQIKSIDGTQYIFVPIQYSTVDLSEYWVKVPMADGTYQDRIITVINNKYIIRDEINELGFIPFQWCRTKVRKYDSYGRGYIDNTRGLQDLVNACVNLGFDSLKINSMDIVIVDETKIKDPASIKYKPLAVWKMKDINGVKITRNPQSAIGEVLRGAQMIDQIHQDATGVTRQAQGQPNLSGSGDSEQTLGEYKLKLQMVDKRFLDQARFIENDYLEPLLNKVLKIVLNPKLFYQKDVNDILGFHDMDEIDTTDGKVKISKGTKKIPRLDLAELRKKHGVMNYYFRCVGATKFGAITEQIQKYSSLLTQSLGNPILLAMTNIDVVWRKLIMSSGMVEYDEVLKPEDQCKVIAERMSQPQQSQPVMPGMMGQSTGSQGGMPRPGGNGTPKPKMPSAANVSPVTSPTGMVLTPK